MMLRYKQYIINKIATAGDMVKFFESSLIDYVNNLGHIGDFYNCWSWLQNEDDDKHNGIDYEPTAKYYVYDKNDDVLYWYHSYKDALLMAGFDFDALTKENFMKYRRRSRNGFYMLLPEDIYELDALVEEHHIYCHTREIEFNTIEEAAIWLVNSGAAANANVAKRALEKHLKGETSCCYKMKFELV